MVNLLGLPIRVAEEVISAVPALVDRTRSQLELTQHILEKLPCSPLHRSAASRPEHAGASDPTSPDAPAATVTDIRTHQHPAPGGTEHDRNRSEPAQDDVEDLPEVSADDMAIPDYDSLAASQVVPRLASLEPAELAQVLVYEQSHRARQTIINRVRQLQAATDGT